MSKTATVFRLFTPKFTVNRYMSAATGKRLAYTAFGEPAKVIQKEEYVVEEPRGTEVLVKMLAAPINPADINMIQGKYPVKPKFPAVAGNEGVGEVVSIGSGVKNLQIGDRVIPLQTALGTWRTHLQVDESDMYKIPKDLGIIEAAGLTVNPCTAYRMLRDFEDLQPGDTVIQNGGNSACGQNVIQLCKAWGINTVNIVRDRKDLRSLVRFLEGLGATYVLTEEELRSTQIFKGEYFKKPKLALNCVGGKNALEVLRHLDKNGTMVTYGGMSREPVTIPTSSLIFKNLKLRGFWMTQWSKDAEYSKRSEMYRDIITLMLKKQLQGPAYKLVEFHNYTEAILNTMSIEGMAGKKYILSFDDA